MRPALLDVGFFFVAIGVLSLVRRVGMGPTCSGSSPFWRSFILVVVWLWEVELVGHTVHFWCDNQAVVHVSNSLTSRMPCMTQQPLQCKPATLGEYNRSQSSSGFIIYQQHSSLVWTKLQFIHPHVLHYILQEFFQNFCRTLTVVGSNRAVIYPSTPN